MIDHVYSFPELIEDVRRRPAIWVGPIQKDSKKRYKYEGVIALVKKLLDYSLNYFEKRVANVITITATNNSIMFKAIGTTFDVIDFEEQIMRDHYVVKSPYDEDINEYWDYLWMRLVVSALSSNMIVERYNNTLSRRIVVQNGVLISNEEFNSTNDQQGMMVSFVPDIKVFGERPVNLEYIREIAIEYAACNPKISFYLNEEQIDNKLGMQSYIMSKTNQGDFYNAIYIENGSCNIAIVPSLQPGGGFLKSFVNCQETVRGGAHEDALVDAINRSLFKPNIFGRTKYNWIKHFMIAFNVMVPNPIWVDSMRMELGSGDIFHKRKATKLCKLSSFGTLMPMFSCFQELLHEKKREIYNANPTFKEILEKYIMR